MIKLTVILSEQCVRHYPTKLSVCISSPANDCVIYWNNKQWHRLNNKIVYDTYKLLHMALYVMAKYPNWAK